MKDSIEFRAGVEWNILYAGDGKASEPVSARIIDMEGRERVGIVPDGSDAGFRLVIEGELWGVYDAFDDALDKANEHIYHLPPEEQEGLVIRELTGKEGIFHVGGADGERYLVNAFWSDMEPGYVNYGVFALGEDDQLKVLTSGFCNGYLATEDCVRDLVADFVPVENPRIQFVAFCCREFDTAAEYRERLDEGLLKDPVTVPVWPESGKTAYSPERTYWEGAGKYQEVADGANEIMPNIGYTQNPDMNLFVAMSHLYYDLYNNGACNIAECYADAVGEHILPKLPDFDAKRFIDEDYSYAEQQMDLAMRHLKGRSLEYPQFDAWLNSGEKLVSKHEPADKDGWSKVVFGLEKERDSWIERRVRNLGEKEVAIAAEAPRLPKEDREPVLEDLMKEAKQKMGNRNADRPDASPRRDKPDLER